MAESRLELSEIVGVESQQGQRIQAGWILSLMDMVAGRVAASHAQSPVATLSFDRVDLTRPIHHQDLVRLQGQLIRVGRSSMVVDVTGYRRELMSRETEPVIRSFITMVAVDDEGRPNTNIPQLIYQTPVEERIQQEVEHRREMTGEWLAIQQEVENRSDWMPDEVEEDFGVTRREWLAPQETEMKVCRQFLPRNVNVNGTIFGGDILRWMDRVAVHTAREFTRNFQMVTIAMNRIFFKKPIFANDLVELTARVVYVRRYTLEVEIKVKTIRVDGTVEDSHNGFFTVLNFDGSGFKRPIPAGLKLEPNDQEGLRDYQKAKVRHKFWQYHKESFPDAFDDPLPFSHP